MHSLPAVRVSSLNSHKYFVDLLRDYFLRSLSHLLKKYFNIWTNTSISTNCSISTYTARD